MWNFDSNKKYYFQLLEPKMTCVKAESHVQCMYYIDQAGKGEAVGADVVVLDAGDIYRSDPRNLALFTQPHNNLI